MKPLPFQAMPEEQLSALLAKLKDDAGLREQLQGAADLDAAVAIAQEAGFNVNKADWLKYQAKQAPELNDDELEKAAGGFSLQSDPATDYRFYDNSALTGGLGGLYGLLLLLSASNALLFSAC